MRSLNVHYTVKYVPSVRAYVIKKYICVLKTYCDFVFNVTKYYVIKVMLSTHDNTQSMYIYFSSLSCLVFVGHSI